MFNRCSLLLFLLAPCCLAICAGADDTNAKSGSVAGGFAAGLAVVDEGLEEAVILQAMTSDRLLRHTRGIVGEASTENALAHYLNRNGRVAWRAMTPRTGPQGIDHLFVKYNESGIPVDLYVGESKWGASQLGNTKDGPQMRSLWTKNRLAGIGGHYNAIAKSQQIACREIPRGSIPDAEIAVMIKGKDGQLVERVFWRESRNGDWLFSGGAKELKLAQRAAGIQGQLYDAGAKGKIGYRRSVYHWKASGDDLILRIDTINKLDVLSKGTTENGRKITIIGGMKQSMPPGVIDEIVKKLKRQHEFKDWKPSELRRMVKSGADSYKKAIEQDRLRTVVAGAKAVGIATGAAVGIDVAIQLIARQTVDWNQVAMTGVKTFTAVSAGELAGFGLMKLGVGSRFVRSGAKAGVIAAAFSAFDYYQVYKGNMSWEDANANTLIAGASMGAGAATGAALMALPAMLGATASTGTAIASLSGAAATSSTLAVYGGGTVAAGGLGVWGGAIVVGGAVAIVAIGVGAAAAWGYSVYKEGKEWDQVKEWGDWLQANCSQLNSLSTMSNGRM